MSWFQIWTVSWQVSVILTPLIVGVAILWLRSQFVTKADAVTERNRVDAALKATSQEAKTEANRVDAEMARQKSERDARYEQIRDKTGDHEGRLKLLEAESSKPPTRHTLNNEITKLIGVVSRLESSVSGLAEQAKTTQSYLHTLVERGLDR